MPEPIVVSPLSVPVGTCIPGNAQELVNLTAQYLSATFQNGQYALWNFGANTPDSTLQDRPWFRTTADGKPIGPYLFYNGKWVRQGPIVGAVIMYTGPGAGSAYFDSTGKGMPGTEGEGWLILNGNNGTVNMSEFFPVGGFQNGGQWVAELNNTGTPTTTGGTAQLTLVGANIPPLNAQVPRGSSQPGSAAGFQYGASSADGSTVNAVVTSGAAQPILLVPPYIAFGFLTWNPYI